MSKLRTDELENLSGSVTILVANLLQSSDLTATNTTYDNTSSGLTATDVQAAVDEVDGNLDTLESSFNSHTGSGGSAHATATTLVEGFMSTSDKTKLNGIETAATADQDASEVPYDNTISGLTASDVQAAIDEVDSNLDSTDSSLSSHTSDLTIHRTINDAGTATTDLWSADKIGTELSGKLDTTAQAADSDLLDGQEGTYYLDRANHTGTQTLSTISDSGTAAAADLTTSATDTTAGRAMATGLGGLGVGSPTSISDFNAHTVPGFWKTNNNSQAEMPLSGNFYVLQFQYDGNAQAQIAIRADGVGPFIRNKIGGTWESTWDVFYQRKNILGTVSQSSGVPTGAIIEQGSNSNGEYTKFADGTMICFQGGLSVGIGNADYLTGNWTFPAEFTSPPIPLFTATPSVGDGSSVFRKAGIIGAAGVTAADSDIRLSAIVGNDWVSGDEITSIRGYAIGRWF